MYNITELRIICKQLKIEKFDIGNKGLTIKFKNNHFEKTDQLVEFMSQYKYDLKLRSDQTLVYNYQKTSNKDRIYKAFSLQRNCRHYSRNMGVLSGYKIIELSGIGPGPLCGMLFADLGLRLFVLIEKIPLCLINNQNLILQEEVRNLFV